MALKDSLRQIARAIGVLQPVVSQPPPGYGPAGYPPQGGGYYDGGPDVGPYDYGGMHQGNPGYGGGAPIQQQPDARFYGEGGYPPQAPQAPPPQYSQQPSSVFGNNQRSKHPPNNVVQMPRPEDGGAARASKHSEIIVHVRVLEDCQLIIDALLETKSVFINMESLDDLLMQRVIDMLGGASFALRGTMTKISHRAYLVAPNTVDVINSQGAGPGPSFRNEFSALRR